MSIYEQNFSRLTRLIPELFKARQAASRQFGGLLGLKLEIVERHKYTTVIKLSQRLPLAFASASKSAMTVRVYHDARVAEVLAYQDHSRFQPKYDYPNPHMRQVREKQRVNEFLGEWLEFCIADGLRRRVAPA